MIVIGSAPLALSLANCHSSPEAAAKLVGAPTRRGRRVQLNRSPRRRKAPLRGREAPIARRRAHHYPRRMDGGGKFGDEAQENARAQRPARAAGPRAQDDDPEPAQAAARFLDLWERNAEALARMPSAAQARGAGAQGRSS
ncbi:hypothetical protein [Oceanicella actignis]|uniref:hypothetical protein n=1 Tax=Oceanicella actignis TaxID=1189325 RepID=UPI001B86938E|nr:hypothetical protein [Oceanicella actignis]